MAKGSPLTTTNFSRVHFKPSRLYLSWQHEGKTKPFSRACFVQGNSMESDQAGNQQHCWHLPSHWQSKKKIKIMNSITDNTSGHRLMFICFFHLQHSIRNVNGKLFKLNRQKLNSWIRGLGTFLFEISFLFSSPPSPFLLFPIKLKSISLMKSKAFKSSLTFTIAIFPWINKIPYASCWSHRLLLFAGKNGSNILNIASCTKPKESWKLWEQDCSALILYWKPRW